MSRTARPRRAVRAPARRAGPRRPARARALVLALVLLLLILLARCACAPPPPDPPAPPPPPPGAAAPADAGPVAPSAPTPARLAPLPRPALPAAPEAAPTWLPAFHQQVAARSPRLAACFVGAAAPGALRWSARLDLRSGRAGDHRFAPTLEAAPPTADQQACLARALAEPPYQIEVPAPPDLPVPVSLVIEF